MSERGACPRCSGPLQPPGLTSDDYRCDVHGVVPALMQATTAEYPKLRAVADRSDVPAWLPWPLPEGWLLTGVRWADRPDQRRVAVAVAISGHGLVDGPSDLLVVAEQPGIGLGARYAGLADIDPGDRLSRTPSDTKIHTDGHPTALWNLAAEGDRTAYVGEADGCWLWLIGWPELAWIAIHDGLRLTDLRMETRPIDVPTGALTPRILL